MEVKDYGMVNITGEELVKIERGTMEHYVHTKLKEAGAPIVEASNGSLGKDVTNFRWHQRYDQSLDADVFEWERR